MRTSAPSALASSSVPREPGTRIMSPKQVKITPGSLRDGDPVVDAAHRDHAHRAARAVHELDVGGQQVVDAVLVDRVGVAAADLHHLVVAARLDGGEDLARQHLAELGVAELVDELHSVTSATPAWTRTSSPGPGVDQRDLDGVVRAARVLAQREALVVDAQRPASARRRRRR